MFNLTFVVFRCNIDKTILRLHEKKLESYENLLNYIKFNIYCNAIETIFNTIFFTLFIVQSNNNSN